MAEIGTTEKNESLNVDDVDDLTAQIEAELNEYLASTTYSTVKPISATDGVTISATDKVSALDDDFMSWLEETPEKPAAIIATPMTKLLSQNDPSKSLDVEFEVENTIETPATDFSLSMLPTPPPAAQKPTTSTSLATRSMDSLFDEIFGKDRESRAGTPMNTLMADNNIVGMTNLEAHLDANLLPSRKDFEVRIGELLSTAVTEGGLSDVSNLRQLISDGGYIPAEHRVSIWLLLLTGGRYTPDASAGEIRFDPSELLFPSQTDLISDCYSIVHALKQTLLSAGTPLSDTNEGRLFSHLHDLLVVHCLRANIEYNSIFAKLISPVVIPHIMQITDTSTVVDESTYKSIASPCFQALCSSFSPLLILEPLPLNLAVHKIHSWLRMLVSYHSPALVQHLDRVLPGWEQPAKVLTTTQAQNITKTVKGGIDLDELEKELGLENDLDNYSSNWKRPTNGNNTESHAIESAPASVVQLQRSDGAGCIPTHWITAMFAGSLPPNQAATLLDWAILNGERYAGVYLTASLLVLNAHHLQSMHAVTIKTWFESVAANCDNWFTQCSSSDSSPLSSWDAFMRGWIHSTAVLLVGTPQAFRVALSETEIWAVLAAENRRGQPLCDPSDALDAHRHGSPTESTSPTVHTTSTTAPTQSSGVKSAASIMNSLRNFRMQFQTDSEGLFNTHYHHNATNNKNSNSVDTSHWPHDRKSENKTLCLWSDASEVVPCICTNRRRPVAFETVTDAFTRLSTHPSPIPKDKCCRLLSTSSPSTSSTTAATTAANSPFFFGIDCRSEDERRVGLFPKAYCLDPSLVTGGDSEQLSGLLDMLEPVAATVHICLIGVGADYFKWLQKQSNKPNNLLAKAGGVLTGKRSEHDASNELNQLIEEHDAKLNAVAMYFLKRSFLHISILDGGFLEAARYLQRVDSSFSIGVALVDVNLPLLHAVLNTDLPPAADNTVNTTTSTSNSSSLAINSANIATSVTSFINSFSAIANTANTTTNTSNTTSTTNNTANNSTVSNASDSTIITTNSTTTTAVKQMFNGWGKKLELFSTASLDTLKKNIFVAADNTNSAQMDQTSTSNVQTGQTSLQTGSKTHEKNSFVIDAEDDEDDDGMGPREIADTRKISINRTDLERAHALALHRMGGLRKGDVVNINRKELPGAILFPAIKYKSVPILPEDDLALLARTKMDSTDEFSEDTHAGAGEGMKVVQVHRYLVISRERFIVLDSGGEGVGSKAVVKSNHHLTELIRMTFRKKDPELVTLHFVSQQQHNNSRQYRVSKRREFVDALQKNMQRFK